MLILSSKRLLQYYKNSVPHALELIERNFQWMANEATKTTYIHMVKWGVVNRRNVNTR
jgi:hypothetical protein